MDLLVLGCFLLASVGEGVLGRSYNNHWAAECPGGEEAALRVARDTGCLLVPGEVIPASNIFQFTCPHVRRRSVLEDEDVHSHFEGHTHVSWAEQQEVKPRDRRQWGQGWGQPQQAQQMAAQWPGAQQAQPWRLPAQQSLAQDPNAVFDDLMHLNDKHWSFMWYLNRGGKLDMNVQGAWQMGITGKNIVITILDDGIEKANPDLVANYDPQASYDVNQNDGDPTPRYDLIDSNRHGTRCAGEVSATANNSVCGVGVAYDSRIGGVRMLDGDVTDAVEARSISLNNQHIDIYSASWGPDDDGKTVDGPGRLASKAFIEGIKNGRAGKGSIFVWASGNGGRDHDNCNCDGYTNSIWTLSVSSATENGLIPWYSEACSSTMATTYSSGSSGERKVVTTDLHNGCTNSHTGTSASAPMAAGVIALVLEANPSLNWRDVQHLTIRSAHVANLRATDWAVNSLGRNYSHSFGYGIMDATAMVKEALQWTPVPAQLTSSVKAALEPVVIPARTKRTAKMTVTDHGEVNYLEHVQAHVTLSASRRGDVTLILTSPAGTKSQLLARRPHDSSRAGFHDWPFLTVFCWGERPAGEWQLEVQNDGSRYQVELHEWAITFYGTKDDPVKNLAVPPPSPSPAPTPSPTPVPASQPAYQPPVYQPPPQPKPLPAKPIEEPLQQQPAYTSVSKLENCVSETGGWCLVCAVPHILHLGRCVQQCPHQGFFQGSANSSATCLPCYYSCQSCTGPNDYQCSTCYGDAELDSNSDSGSFCHNKGLIFKIFSSSRWYYVLSIGFLVNFLIVIVLVLYIIRRKRAKAGKTSLLSRVKSGGNRYSPVSSSGLKAGAGLLKGASSLPFTEYESDSEESEEFVKPYSDDPSESPSFLKPYKDDQ